MEKEVKKEFEQDIADIRRHFVYRDEFEDLAGRVKYLEKKLGVEIGKS